jgi:4-hydroxy-tetrahydrodipicolinate synthase
MLPGTGAAIEAARQAVSEGADAVIVGSPYYFGVEGDAQARHIEAVIEAAGRGALLYNIPQCTHHTLAPAVVERLARDPRVLGIKDSAGDFQAFQGFVAVKRERSSFRVLQGNEPLAAASLLLGGDGLVPGVANVAAGVCVEMVRAAARADASVCAKLQERVNDLAGIYAQGPWLPALKAACALVGIGNGEPAPPLAPAAAAHRREVEAILRRQGLLGGRA